MIRKLGEGKIRPLGWGNSRQLINEWHHVYGEESYECISTNKKHQFIFSQSKPFDLIELEQLLQSVGWSRRPLRRVQKALDNSLLKVGLWQHDPRFPRLIGFARCTGDGVLQATVWDVAIHPVYQGFGLGKELMSYVMKSLKIMNIERVILFADPGVVSFYKSQGWMLEPNGYRCAFWYAN
ncbi:MULTISPECIES: GNAT family N-acetyltransferase [unclassified Prochlorococcus]|uniref:GNAT family N-acetyltransferase n=1 Tax=unclassified Prochlorococcus TaxID=2627481 RepID=UPI0005336E2A|nr:MULTISPECIES: GNAT family N-acetyltransferase [unclassified Prochlorococcus]KGG16395.1 N-acetyltransferase (GNAT) family [Prochlorococcus sp. MIT 0602]KGG17130.1 N-acetyltransferase (GNAT) family [Prochlorococcus sp. MIT 0603]